MIVNWTDTAFQVCLFRWHHHAWFHEIIVVGWRMKTMYAKRVAGGLKVSSYKCNVLKVELLNVDF